MKSQLQNLNCLDGLIRLGPNSVDFVIADPPYSSGGLHFRDRARPPEEKYISRSGIEGFDHDNRDQRSWTARAPHCGYFRHQAEYIVWGSKGRISTDAAGPLPGVFRVPGVSGRKKTHLAEKPLALIESLMQFCPPGGVVLDPFAGAGTVSLAAQRTGRHCLAYESNYGIYCRALERLGYDQ